MPHLRIFPHSQEEFPSLDFLQTWLMTVLKARGGIYNLRNRNAVADLPGGSIVLFRYGDQIIGEAVVRGYKRETHPTQPAMADGRPYEAHVEFAPDSLRLYAPPVAIKALQAIVGNDLPIMVPNGYYIIRDWGSYPKLLSLHMEQNGRFL
jgi:hypothetical protein